MLRSILQLSAFATLDDDGRAVGFALAVYELGMIGLFDIAVAPA